MTQRQIVNLLKSGNFTIVYWDSQDPTLYKGKWDYNKEFEKDDYATMDKSKVDYSWWDEGYVPGIVTLLVKALGGKSDSI